MRKKLKLKQLYNQTFISTGEDTNSHNMLLKACHNEGFTSNFAIYANDLLCCHKYIEAGIGIGITRNDLNINDNIRYLDVPHFVEIRSIYVFYQNETLSDCTKNSWIF